MTTGIESIAALSALQPASLTAIDGMQKPAPAAAFADFISKSVGELQTNVDAAEDAMRSLATGESVELHDVMISLERARISVQTFLQVRNKLIESYQDLMRMQL